MIFWIARPELFSIGSYSVRWYGALWGAGLLAGYHVTRKIFEAEDRPVQDLDRAFVYFFIGALGGARLGQCLFYEPAIYLHDPLRIFMLWEGGLASHGALLGVFAALWLFARRHPVYRLSWLLDRVTLSLALGGAFVRIGNLFNSEIVGKPTRVPWAFIFPRVDQQPRHPTQIYEALACLALFFVMRRMYWRGWAKRRPLSMLGVFLVGICGIRFCLEFLKENQESFESALPFGLNLGQWLSVPLALLGVALLAYASRAAAGGLDVDGAPERPAKRRVRREN